VHTVSGEMDVPVPDSLRSALGELRKELQGELGALVERRSGLEIEMQALDQEIETKQRALELVEATERQLAGQGRGQPDVEGAGPGASTQVRGSGIVQVNDKCANVSFLWQSMPAATLTRPCPKSPYASPPLQPLLPRALPMAVWEDYLLPLLTWKDVLGLVYTCKALRVVMGERFAGDLYLDVPLARLRAVLKAFPRVRKLTLDNSVREWDDEGKDTLVAWLREEGRGRHVTDLRLRGDVHEIVHAALREGALPSLKSLKLNLGMETARASLKEGLFGAIQDLHLAVGDDGDNDEEIKVQLAALGLLRHLPSLAKLKFSVNWLEGDAMEWPPFIPPSLKEFKMDMSANSDSYQSLLLALPGMLEASGAGLERFEILIDETCVDEDGWLVPLAQILRCCSPTFRSFRLMAAAPNFLSPWSGLSPWSERGEGSAEESMARLRVQCADVLAGVSACRELEMLVLPCTRFEPLFPPGTAFGRLTHLEIHDNGREDPPDAGAMGLWELMASGGLPVLAKLCVFLKFPWGGVEEVKHRMAPAFEAVAGPLTHLNLVKPGQGEWLSDPLDVGYEVGVAVGKLWRRLIVHSGVA
jgi:hypothetical protein